MKVGGRMESGRQSLVGGHSAVGVVAIAILAAFAFVPGTLVNWNYNYFQFLPLWFVAATVLAALGVAVLLPRLPHFRHGRAVVCVLTAVALPLCFWFFRTRIHLFDGDAGGGPIPADLSYTWRDFVPPLPGVGRIDTYGLSPLAKFLFSHGWLSGCVGNAGLLAEQVYVVLVGALDVLVAVVLFRRNVFLLAALLTTPCIHNLFGNADCYPLPMGINFVFLYASVKMFGRRELTFRHVAGYALFWLFCGYAHPCSGFSGFLPALLFARWFNGLRFKWKVPERGLCALFALVMVSCVLLYYKKTWFSAAIDQNPPIFSAATFIHMLNTAILPVLPLAYFVLTGPLDGRKKGNLVLIFALQMLCFMPGTFRQGANDVFAYMMFTFHVLVPWLVAAAHMPLRKSAWCSVIACQLLVLVPLVAVHSTERTCERAMALYPIDNCVHNTIMSWQTHLGLKLGDNLVESPIVKRSLYKVFWDGAQRAEPKGLRGGNYLYYVAFHYQFGDFHEGRRMLADLLKRDPGVVRYFLSVRPGFIYLNRQRLWDDLCELFPVERERNKLKEVVDGLRRQAAAEVYCPSPPSYAKCPY